MSRLSRVTKPGRLARFTAELLPIEADLSKHGIGLVVLSMGGERLDTRKPTSKLMLTIPAGVTTWERAIMLERQREGIAKACSGDDLDGLRPSCLSPRTRPIEAQTRRVAGRADNAHGETDRPVLRHVRRSRTRQPPAFGRVIRRWWRFPGNS